MFTDESLFQMEEKARLEAEAREREEQQLLEERRRRRQQEEEEALQKELLRLQELQHQQHRVAKKKKKEKAKENTAPPQNNPQPLRQTAQNVLDNLQNGKSQLLQTLIHLPHHREPKLEPLPQPSSQHKCPAAKGVSNETNIPNTTGTLHNGTPSIEVNSKAKAKQSGKGVTPDTPVKIVQELAKSSGTTKTANGSAPTTTTDTKAMRFGPAETPASPPTTEACREERSNIRCNSGKRQQQQQPLTQIKEDRISPLVSNRSPSPSPTSQTEIQLNGKPPSAESPQPKGKTKKSKKKKGDKMNTSIGWYHKDSVRRCNGLTALKWFKNFSVTMQKHQAKFKLCWLT